MGKCHITHKMQRKIIPYNPKLKALARQLRQNMTLSEVLLWQELKNGQMQGFDFDRQRPIDEFIVDFYCKDLMLAIEIDGQSHSAEAIKYDEHRQKRLEDFGVRFLRFDDLDVKKKMSWVLEEIELWIFEQKDELVGRFENRAITNTIHPPPIPTQTHLPEKGNL